MPTQAQLAANVKPVLTKVANQPPYNNIMPCYTPDDKIIFASDRPYNGQPHLTQREEYLGLPTTSGLWKLDPANASSLKLMHHSPSGAFSPQVDSAGRLVFVNWDHMSRDIEAVTDERDSIPTAPYNEPAPTAFGGWHATGNGSGNFADETSGAAFTPGTAWTLGQHLDIFPEPRNADKKTLFDEFSTLVGGVPTLTLNGVTTNIFLPWMLNLDGTGGEILNHVGRHEVAGAFNKSFALDGTLVNFSPTTSTYAGLVAHNAFNNFMWMREDPLNPGTFFGVDAVDLGTHGAGGIVKLTNAGAGVNPDTMTVTYITGSVTGARRPLNIPVVRVGMNITTPVSPLSPLATPETIYRNAVPLKDGALVATAATGIDQTDWNRGSVAAPSTPWNFRLKSLKPSGAQFVPDVTLTNGITINASYWVPGQSQITTWSGTAWELDPAEVAPITAPTTITAGVVDPIESAAFTTANVHLPTFQNWLTGNNYALSVSRNVTMRDRHDRQQPFNLKIAWSNTQTLAPSPANTPIYSIGWVQFLQADLRRGYTLGGALPAAGRRVVATPLNGPALAENVQTAGAPPGATRLGNDGSFAVIIPAGKAVCTNLLDNDAAKTSQVKERFWVTFQPGEIRTCANCHGINTTNQTDPFATDPVHNGKPTNTPQALLTLLAQWKGTHPPGAMQHAVAAVSVVKSAGPAMLSVTRTGGSTGPVSVDFATADGTAIAGMDYTARTGTLNWADGDVAPKTISIPLFNPLAIAGPKTLSVTLSNPAYGALGATTVNALTLTETPFNAWAFTHFGSSANTPGIGGVADDPDGDGQDNQSEFAAGTVPNDATSVFRIANVTRVADGLSVSVSWSSVAGGKYQVQTTPSLQNANWQDVGAPVTATAASASISLPISPFETLRFYRVRLGP